MGKSTKQTCTTVSLLRQLYNAAIEAVDGRGATEQAIKDISAEKDSPITSDRPIYVIAIGKAADAMALGSISILKDKVVGGLVITKTGHLSDELKEDAKITAIESGHPVPNQQSLYAGKKLVEVLQAIPKSQQLLLLISGGASALVEHLVEPLQLNDLIKLTERLLAEGQSIGEINQQRKSISQIKDGKLACFLPSIPITQFLISDVPGDELSDIGSGLLIPKPGSTNPIWLQVDTRIIASSAIAQQAVAAEAAKMGLEIQQKIGSLNGELPDTLNHITATLTASNAGAGVYIWGGETTVVLPESPGRGGRNQHLALSLAERIQGINSIAALCAGTDGTDGPTEDAGGLINEKTISKGRSLKLNCEASLAAADAGNYLEQTGALFTTGPTGTNVMDLVIVILGCLPYKSDEHH